MSIWALIPQKGFQHGKSRLKPTLSDGARSELARTLFDHVLGVVSEVVDGTLVCTDSPEVAEAAARRHARVLRDRAGATGAASGLAAVVDGGLAELTALGAGAALVLMADLPRLTTADVRSLIAPLADHDAVLVRAQDGHHTNALVVSPPGSLATAFGRADSFEAHLAAARAANLRVCVLENPRIAFDVDDPADHAASIRRA